MAEGEQSKDKVIADLVSKLSSYSDAELKAYLSGFVASYSKHPKEIINAFYKIGKEYISKEVIDEKVLTLRRAMEKEVHLPRGLSWDEIRAMYES